MTDAYVAYVACVRVPAYRHIVVAQRAHFLVPPNRIPYQLSPSHSDFDRWEDLQNLTYKILVERKLVEEVEQDGLGLLANHLQTYCSASVFLPHVWPTVWSREHMNHSGCRES